MRDRLIELLRQIEFDYSEECACAFEDGYKGAPDFAKFFADHLLANGAIVPPCKVGETIYFVSRGEIIPMVVNCISFNGNYQYCLNCNYADEDKYGYSLLTFTDKVRGYMFGFTREEAEKALTERSENEHRTDN